MLTLDTPQANQKRPNAIRAVAAAIGSGTLDRPRLNAILGDLHGANDATGAWTQRDSFELMEQGLVAHLRGVPG